MFVPSICTHNSSSESTLTPPLFHRSVSGKRKAIGMRVGSDAKDLGSGVFIGLVVDTRIKKREDHFCCFALIRLFNKNNSLSVSEDVPVI